MGEPSAEIRERFLRLVESSGSDISYALRRVETEYGVEERITVERWIKTRITPPSIRDRAERASHAVRRRVDRSW